MKLWSILNSCLLTDDFELALNKTTFGVKKGEELEPCWRLDKNDGTVCDADDFINTDVAQEWLENFDKSGFEC